MTDIDMALALYDANKMLPHHELVYKALKALRDREKGCDACTEADYPIEWILKYDEPNVLESGSTKRELRYKAKFCPKCGRNLESEVSK